MSLRSRLLAGYVALVVLTSGATMLVIDRSIGDAMVGELDGRLVGQAKEVRRWLEERGNPAHLAPRLARVVGAHITIVGPDGTILGDSSVDPPLHRPVGDAPDIAMAREYDVGRGQRVLEPGGPVMYLVAVKTKDGGAIRVAVPLSSISARRRILRNRILLASAVGLGVAALLGLWAIASLTRPLREMTRTAERFAKGDYSVDETAGTGGDELALLSRTLALLGKELRAVEKLRREFLASAAHELRTPVTAISGYAETLLGGGVDDAAAKEFLGTIHRNAERITRLVEDLLELERLDARPERTTKREPVEVAPVVAHAAASTRAAAAARGLDEPRIEHDGVPAELAVLGDQDGLEHVVQNLIDNAVLHGAGTVRVTARRDAGRVELAVADDGPGIAPEHQARIFERFYRVDAGRNRARGGSGLGLAIVHQQVVAMGGAIRVESEPGKGARFVVTLDYGPSS